MKARIDKRDLAHLASFPASERAKILERLTSVRPVEQVVLDGSNDFEKALLKLRKEGYALIDVQRQETAFTCIWHRKTRSLFNGAGADVTMLLWEMHERGSETTVLSWRF
jgi:hypothetical protein